MLWPVLLLFVEYSECHLWRSGIVHYAINDKDYDFHSRDIIHQVLTEIQNLTCLKFFSIDFNPNVTYDKTLYISNPQKRKDCLPGHYDYSKNIIDMPIGYKCLNDKDIARTVVDMIKASVGPFAVTPVNSVNVDMKLEGKVSIYEKKYEAPEPSALLSRADRNFINTHYHEECDALSAAVTSRHRQLALRTGSANQTKMSEDNVNYYADVTWPLGIVLYGVDQGLRQTDDHKKLIEAMSVIQRSSCVVFQEVQLIDKELEPKAFIWFGGSEGADIPKFGFYVGQQILNMKSFVTGDPGHDANILNLLLRILGVEMMSNRFDRDNYLTINWNNIQPGKQQYFEKGPRSSWIDYIRYDFTSATHAPANFLCKNCDLGETTVQPLKDYMWQRSMEMGHTRDLSETDIEILKELYYTQCRNRLQ